MPPCALCGCALVKLARPGALLPTLAALGEASVGRLANSDPNVGRPSRLLFLSSLTGGRREQILACLIRKGGKVCPDIQ